MARVNVAQRNNRTTHEGGPANPPGSPQRQLRRAVASCLLWEDGFYENGVEIAERIKQLVSQCPQEFVADLAVQARNEFKLRHAPLWLLACMFAPDRKPVPGMAAKVAAVLQRADEPGELIALFQKAWPDSKSKIPAAVKRGIADAMGKFDAYQLAKWKN